MKTPNIRLKKYSGPWAKISLSDNAEFTRGKGYKKGDLRTFGNEIILYGKMYTDYKSSYFNVDTYADLRPNSVLSTGRDVIIPSSGETAEDISIASAVLKENIILGGDLNIIRPAENIDPLFLAMSISRGKIKNELTKMAEGATISHLRNDSLRKIELPTPDIKEQKDISNLFLNLDKKLEIEKEKHQKLVDFKKAMLEDMFPKEGEKVPKIRFGGFTEDWDVYNLKDLGEISSSGVDKKIYSNERIVYLLNYMDVYNKKQPTISNINTFMKTSATESQIISKEVRAGDLFFTPSSETSEDIGHSMAVFNDIKELVYSYHILRFRPNPGKLDIKFSNYFANVSPVRNQLIINSQEAQRMTLKMGEFEKLIVKIPCLKEQEKIGQYLYNLDEKIEISSQKIEKIENFKKALMEKMFV